MVLFKGTDPKFKSKIANKKKTFVEKAYSGMGKCVPKYKGATSTITPLMEGPKGGGGGSIGIDPVFHQFK